MKIKKFKFIDRGMSGVVAETVEARIKDNVTVFVDHQIKYKVPIPRDIIDQVQKLKFHMLVLLGLMPAKGWDCFSDTWELQDYDKKLNKEMYTHVYDLMQHLFITGFLYEDEKVLITATMKGHDDLTYALNTPLYKIEGVTMEWEDSMAEIMRDSKRMVLEFIEDVKLRTMAPRQYLLDLFHEKEEEQQRVTALTDEQAEEEMKEKLAKKGYIMFKPEEVIEEIHETNNAIKEDEIKPDPVPGLKKATSLLAEKVNAKEKEYLAAEKKEENKPKKVNNREWVGLPETGELLPVGARRVTQN